MYGNGGNGCALTHAQPVACAAGFFTLSSVEKRIRCRIAAGIRKASQPCTCSAISEAQASTTIARSILHCCERSQVRPAHPSRAASSTSQRWPLAASATLDVEPGPDPREAQHEQDLVKDYIDPEAEKAVEAIFGR